MKRNIYILFSSATKALFALALTVFSGTAYAQNTYTFNYTGNQQTITLQAGTYTFEAWGADGGNNLGNGSTTFLQNGGKGAYSMGTYTLASPTLIYVNVGGKGSNSTAALNTTVSGGYNGGGYGGANAIANKSSGAGGGGASHVATATGVLSALVSNTAAVRIVAGGGGGPGESNYANNNAAYNSNGGNGGGASGLQNVSSSYQGRHGQGGTQIAGGGGGDNGSAVAGPPLQGIFGAGGYNPTAGTNASAGGSGAGGGGGGWYGGGAGWVSSGSAYQSGAGGGGSGYIGGVSSGSTIVFGLAGFVANPDVTGNGMVLIRELCSITLMASTANSLSPVICLGQSLTLTTNAISNYTWSTGSNAAAISVTPNVTTSYSLTAMSPSNCMTSAVITVTVSAGAPVLTVTASSPTVCLGNTVSISAAGALTYTFSGGVSNGVPFSPVATTAYTVQGQNGCGMTSSVTTITITPLPVVAMTASNVVCSGNTTTLTGGGATNYTWQPGSITGATVAVSPAANTIYTVTGTTGNCAGINTVAVNTNPNPTLTASSTHTSLCQGQSATLTANGGLSYTWQPGGQIGSVIVVSPTSPTGYMVTGNNSFGCTGTAQQAMPVFASPTINLSTNTPTICSGGSATISATGANTYTWSTNANTNTISVSPAATTIYTVVGTNASTQCTDTKMITLNVFVPNVLISPTTAICIGATTTLTASGAMTYNWSTGGSGPVISVNPQSTTVYTVTGNTPIGSQNCAGTNTTQVAVNPLPTITAVPSRSNICKNESTQITASGANTYSWGTGATTTVISVSPLANTIYTLEGTSTFGCKNTGSALVRVFSCVGLVENSQENARLQVYPNPSNGVVIIQSDEAMELILVNELGQLIQTISLQEQDQFSVQLKDLSSGVYFLQSKDPQIKLNKKLIVQE